MCTKHQVALKWCSLKLNQSLETIENAKHARSGVQAGKETESMFKHAGLNNPIQPTVCTRDSTTNFMPIEE